MKLQELTGFKRFDEGGFAKFEKSNGDYFIFPTSGHFLLQDGKVHEYRANGELKWLQNLDNTNLV
jgi:hypothetical protein